MIDISPYDISWFSMVVKFLITSLFKSCQLLMDNPGSFVYQLSIAPSHTMMKKLGQHYIISTYRSYGSFVGHEELFGVKEAVVSGKNGGFVGRGTRPVAAFQRVGKCNRWAWCVRFAGLSLKPSHDVYQRFEWSEDSGWKGFIEPDFEFLHLPSCLLDLLPDLNCPIVGIARISLLLRLP